MLVAWVLSLIAVFYLGFYFRTLKDQLKAVQEVVKAKVDKKVEVETKSELIDPLDPIQEALYLQKKNMEEMNRGK